MYIIYIYMFNALSHGVGALQISIIIIIIIRVSTLSWIEKERKIY